MATTLTALQFIRLVRLSRQLSRVLELDGTPGRDAATGAFTKGGSVTAPAIRVAWGLGKRSLAGREVFKQQLLAALRAPRK
jgi:hypothetical protein